MEEKRLKRSGKKTKSSENNYHFLSIKNAVLRMCLFALFIEGPIEEEVSDSRRNLETNVQATS